VASMLVSVFLIGPAVKRFGERTSMLTGIAVSAMSAAWIALAYTGTLFLASIPLSSLGGLTSPSLMAIASREVDETQQGRLQGSLSSLQGIAMMIAPILLAEMFSTSIQRGGRPYSGVPFAFASLVLCAALAIAARATRPVLATGS